MILRQLQILTNKKITENADVDNSIQLLQVGFIKSSTDITDVISNRVIQEQLEKMPGEPSSVEQDGNINENNAVENFDFSSTDYDDLFRAPSEAQHINDEYNIF